MKIEEQTLKKWNIQIIEGLKRISRIWSKDTEIWYSQRGLMNCKDISKHRALFNDLRIANRSNPIAVNAVKIPTTFGYDSKQTCSELKWEWINVPNNKKEPKYEEKWAWPPLKKKTKVFTDASIKKITKKNKTIILGGGIFTQGQRGVPVTFKSSDSSYYGELETAVTALQMIRKSEEILLYIDNLQVVELIQQCKNWTETEIKKKKASNLIREIQDLLKTRKENQQKLQVYHIFSHTGDEE